MQEIIDFLRKKEIDFELNQDSETASLRFKIGGCSMEIPVSETDTVESFTNLVNILYENVLKRDYKYHSVMAESINKKLSEYKGIL